MIRALTFISITLSIIFSELIKPNYNSTINYTHVLFEWEQINEAHSYQLQIATDSNFTNILTDINNESLIYIEKNNIDWNTQYYWRVRSLDSSDSPFGDWLSSEFSTSQKRSNAQATILSSDEIQDGITIFSSFFDYFSAIIDKNGNEIWNTEDTNIVYYNTDFYGQLFGAKLDASLVNNLPGLEFSLDNETIWMEPNDTFVHHDFFQLPNNNYMGLAESHQNGPIPTDLDFITLFYFQALGYQADGITSEYPWTGDRIIEWNPDGTEAWSWDTFDYLDLSDYDLVGGTWNEAYLNGTYDWTHSNAILFHNTESAIYLSSRHLSRIIKIDYPSGDIIWQMGLPMPSGDIDCGQDFNFSFQHSLQVLENGNILTLDNGNISTVLYNTEYPTTRALEIAVTDTDDGCEAEIVWEYSLPEDLFGFASGNVQKLDNGNYLITTVGGGATSLEIKPTGANSGDIVWQGNYQLSIPSGAAYRAHRISGLYPIVFSATKYPNTPSSFRLWNDGEIDEVFNIDFGGSVESHTIASGNYVDIDLNYGENNIEITPTHRLDLSKYFIFNFYPGDANLDSAVNILDLIVIVNYIIGNTNFIDSQIALSDFNNDGIVDILDVSSIIYSIANN
tara:strand:+ start:2652 stop:4511 length:1860 start_codon:yes stop_codon:yes gene_type:complete